MEDRSEVVAEEDEEVEVLDVEEDSEVAVEAQVCPVRHSIVQSGFYILYWDS